MDPRVFSQSARPGASSDPSATSSATSSLSNAEVQDEDGEFDYSQSIQESGLHTLAHNQHIRSSAF